MRHDPTVLFVGVERNQIQTNMPTENCEDTEVCVSCADHKTSAASGAHTSSYDSRIVAVLGMHFGTCTANHHPQSSTRKKGRSHFSAHLCPVGLFLLLLPGRRLLLLLVVRKGVFSTDCPSPAFKKRAHLFVAPDVNAVGHIRSRLHAPTPLSAHLHNSCERHTQKQLTVSRCAHAPPATAAIASASSALLTVMPVRFAEPRVVRTPS